MSEGARVVAMLRDPGHVVDSIRRRGNVPAETGKERWSKAIRIIYQVHQEMENRIHLTRFTDLLN